MDISKAITLWDGVLLLFGFGRIHAKLACIKMGIRRTTKLEEISKGELASLGKFFRKNNFLVGPSLERELYLRTSLLRETMTYRAIRVRQGLPSHGQRTHSNAKTARKLSNLWDSSVYAKKMNRVNKKKRTFTLATLYEKIKKKVFITKKIKPHTLRRKRKNKLRSRSNKKRR